MAPPAEARRWGVATWPVLTVLAATAAAFLVARLAGEMIPVGGGLGWDGEQYAALVRGFRGPNGLPMSAYYLDRIVPGALVRAVMRGLDVPFDNANIVLAFQILAAGLIAAGLAAWLAIARHFNLGRTGLWLGAIGLFLNYGILKQGFYYAVLTDLAAFTLAIVAFALFVTGRRPALLAAALVAALTWPPLGISCVALLLFPHRAAAAVAPPAGGRGRIGTAAAAAIAAGLIGWFLHLYGSGVRQVGLGAVEAIDEALMPVSAVAQAALVFGAFAVLFRGLGLAWLRDALRSLKAGNLALAVAAIAIPAAAVALLRAILDAAPSGGISLWTYVDFVAFLPLLRPLASLAAHFAYFGPVVILLVAYWARIAAFVRASGPGLLLFVVINLVIALGPESRQSLPGFAVLVAVLAIVADRRPWRPAALWAFGGLALAASRLWLPINRHDADGIVFLADRYLMNQGPYMSARAYGLHMALLAALALAAAAAHRSGWLLAPRREA